MTHSETSEKTRIAAHELTWFNPGRLSPEKVVAAFSVRAECLQRLLADLVAEGPKSRPQHHLIVGQRGMGKSMLLARIAAELHLNAASSARFVPLGFVEEPYAVDRLSKFWLHCLDSLADSLEAASDPAAGARIDAEVARLTAPEVHSGSEETLAVATYEAFAREARASGRRPVLLVDNLQMVFDRIAAPQQHALREILMRPGAPILIGASPVPPAQDYGAAFYEHFKVHYLGPLSEEEMREMLLHLADAAGLDGVRRRVLQHPERLAVLRRLAGGDPRTVVMLFSLYTEDFAPDIFGDLKYLLDRATPIYKHRIEELSVQQQAIVGTIADHWDPLPGAKIAELSRLPASTISSQLVRLEQLGVLARTELFDTASTGFELAERSFNLWYLMRSACRSRRRQVEFLTRFLEASYEPEGRSSAVDLHSDEPSPTSGCSRSSHALADSVHEPSLAVHRESRVDFASLRESAHTARQELLRALDLESIEPAPFAFDDLQRKLSTQVPRSRSKAPEAFVRAVLGDRRLFLSRDRERLASRTARLDAKEWKLLEATLKAHRALDAAEFGSEAQEWLSARLSSGQVRTPDDVEDWQRSLLAAGTLDQARIVLRSAPLLSIAPEMEAMLRHAPVAGFLDNISADAHSLHEALCACYEGNWGIAKSRLGEALDHRAQGLCTSTLDDWLRASAVMLHLDYGSRLLAFLDERGDTVARLRPWVEALRANMAGSPRCLLGVAAEVRPIAGELFEGIERWLRLLPESTRRWSPPKPRTRRSRRRRS